MCGSATLAMVVSSICMVVDNINDTVSRPLFGTSRFGLLTAAAIGNGQPNPRIDLIRVQIGGS